MLVTTFGVGELSATNGIAGAFSEHVPILHIVGVPSTTQQKSKPMLHHTLGDGRYDAYHIASKQFVKSDANVIEVSTAPAEIDRIITDCVVEARPVYLMLPTDIVHIKIPSKRLLTPLNLQPPENDPETEAFVLDEIVELVNKAESDVIVLVDACTIRHGVKQEVKALLEKTHFPVYSAPMGKTAVPEDYERYGGVCINKTVQCSAFSRLSLRFTSEPSVAQRLKKKLKARSLFYPLVVSRVTSTPETSLTKFQPLAPSR